MKCLYCGKRVLAFRLFSGGEVFCSEEHGNLYRKNEADNAIQRILTLDAPKKPLVRVTPVEIQPAPVEAPPPAPAGFRLPVVEPVGALSDPSPRLELMGSVIEATEIRLSPLALALGLDGLSTFQMPEWRARPATVVHRETAVVRERAARVPRVPESMAGDIARPGQTLELPWRPMGDGAAAAAQWLTLRLPQPAQAPPDPIQMTALGLATATRRQQTWFPLADGTAGLPLSPRPGAEDASAAAALSLPRQHEPRFTSTWTARASYSLWMRACAISGDTALISDGLAGSERPLSAFRLPTPHAERDAQPAGTGPVRLWVPIDDRPALKLALITPDVVAPSQPVVQAAQLASAFAPASFTPLELARCRPWPAVTRVTPETTLELSAWTAWPDLPSPGRAIAHTASLFPAVIPWGAHPGSLSRAALSRLRLLDAPERCLTSSVTLQASQAPELSSAPLHTAARAWPLAAVPPLASPSAISGMLAPAESVRWPVNETEAPRRPVGRQTLAGVAPSAHAPEQHRAITQPGLSREEVALRSLDVSPREYASTPRRLAAITMQKAALQRALPEVEPQAAASPVEISSGVRAPGNCAARACAIAATGRTSSPWASFTGGRPMEKASGQEREVALRLSLEEIPPQCTLDLQLRRSLPATAPCTVLPLTWQTALRDFPLAAPDFASARLRQPETMSPLGASLAGARAGTSGWKARVAAADPVVRRRQLPASRPKMNWPRALAPAQPLSFAAQPFADGASWASALANALAQDSPIEQLCHKD